MKKSVMPTDQLQKRLGSHERDSIWWPTLIGKPIEQEQEEEALKLHKKGVKEWKDIWDKEYQIWKSKPMLITNFNVSNQQINLIGQRFDQWDRGDLWLMPITQKPQIEAFVWKGCSSL